MADADKTSHVSKPLNDAYTGMLAISLLALIGGCVLLFLDYREYEGPPPPPVSREASKPIPKSDGGGAPPEEKKDGNDKGGADKGGADKGGADKGDKKDA